MEMSRRSFLKGAGIGGTYCALSAAMPGTLAKLYASSPEALADEVFSVCEMCSTRCPISARVVDGKNVFIMGNTHSTSFAGKVCARGGSGHSLLYDPERLVKPIQRVGERGEGRWKEISWEQAYRYIAEKLGGIKEEYGPEAVAFSSKGGAGERHIFHLAKAFGSPNTFTHVSTCPGGYLAAAKAMFGSSLKRDFANTNYVVNFGHNIYEGIEMSMAIAMMDSQVDRGAKMVVFDPRFSIVSDKADEWHQIRPGTDVAVALAMCHVLIRDNLYDKAFVARYVSGFEEFAEEVKKYSPEWAEQISDVKASDIIRIATELASQAPHAMVDFGHRSTFTPEEFELRRTLYALNILIGNIERKGGLYFGVKADTYNQLAGEDVAPVLTEPYPKLPDIEQIRIDQADKQFSLTWASGGVYQSILDAALESNPYPIKGWVMTRSNPLQTLAERSKVEKVLKSLDLVVVCDVYVSETAAFADIVLPESTYLERGEEIYDRYGKTPQYGIRQPVVKTIGDTRPGWQIWMELGKELGLGKSYPFTDINEYQLGQLDGDKNELARVREAGWVEYGKAPILLREPKVVENFLKSYSGAKQADSDGTYGSLMKLNTPSGKIELTSPLVEEIAPGRGLIRYREVRLKEDDELYFIQGKVAVHTNAATHNVPMLANLMPDNALWMHPETAGDLGLISGDSIHIHNEYGSEEGRVLVTPGIRKDSVFAYMGFGSKNRELKRAFNQGIHCGNLLPHSIAPVCGMSLHTTGVKVEKT